LLRLVTIPISHYCEKARWALERVSIPYSEERHVQGIHMLAARRAGGGITVPVLVTPDGSIADSADILHWVDARTPAEHRLFPTQGRERDQVEGLCRRLDGELGPKGRRLMYVQVFAQHDLALKFNNQGVPVWEDRAIRHGWPLAKRVIHRKLQITRGVEIADEAAVWRELDFVADLLTDGRPWLCGERFGAADLTFAALSAPIVVPPEYGVALPPLDEFTPAVVEFVKRAREHPAGRYALTLFAEQRRATVR